MKGRWYITSTAVLWSTAGMLVKFLPWSAFSIASFRGLMSFLLLLIVRIRRKQRGAQNEFPFFSAANIKLGMAMFLTSTLYTLALKMTTAANAIVLQYIAPVLVLLYSIIFKKEKIKRYTVILTMVVFGGCVLAFAGQMSAEGLIGSITALFSGGTMAAQIILSRRKGCNAHDGLMIGSGLSFILFLPILLTEPSNAFTLQSLTAALFLGFFQYGLANLFYARGIEQTPAVTAALLLTLEPVLSPVWVFFTMGEVPSLCAVIGLICVIGASTAQSFLAARAVKVRH